MTARRATGAAAYGIADFALVLAPTVVLVLDARTGGIGWHYGADLIVAAGVVAAVHGGFAAQRVHREAAGAHRRADVWIASLDALVVLALAATGLLIAVLVGFAGLHTKLAAAGWPVVVLWGGIHLVAVALAEVVGRAVYRWLEDEPRAPASP